MNILKYVPIFLMIGMVALYSTRNYSLDNSYSQQTSTSISTITLTSTGYGKEKDIAIENAEVKAIEDLLFKGISGNSHFTPLVADELKSKQAHEKYYNELLKKKRYKNFLIGSNSKVSSRSDKEVKRINLDLKVDLDALKKDLADNNVISI